MDCDNCKHKTCWEYAEPCSSCTDMTGVPTNWKPQTNADRIRGMTDEELAEWATTVGRTFGEEYEGYMSALDWLKSPVENEGDDW